MPAALDRFLEQVADCDSRIGGGSAAALTAALAAALLEKVSRRASHRRRLQRIRRECLKLMRRDAEAFAKVLTVDRRRDPRRFARRLKAAIEIPCRLVDYSRTMKAIEREVRDTSPPVFRSDLRCALALTRAARASAEALIEANLTWLNDPAYAHRIRRRLRAT